MGMFTCTLMFQFYYSEFDRHILTEYFELFFSKWSRMLKLFCLCNNSLEVFIL